MKFLHCADVHLDSPMRGLARYDGAPIEQIRGATRRAFERLVRVAIEEAVAFVVIAGDLYDGDRDDFQTAMFFQRQLRAERSRRSRRYRLWQPRRGERDHQAAYPPRGSARFSSQRGRHG